MKILLSMIAGAVALSLAVGLMWCALYLLFLALPLIDKHPFLAVPLLGAMMGFFIEMIG